MLLRAFRRSLAIYLFQTESLPHTLSLFGVFWDFRLWSAAMWTFMQFAIVVGFGWLGIYVTQGVPDIASTWIAIFVLMGAGVAKGVTVSLCWIIDWRRAASRPEPPKERAPVDRAPADFEQYLSQRN